MAARIQSYLVADHSAHAEATQRVLAFESCVIVLDQASDALTRNLAYPRQAGDREDPGGWLPELRAAFARADRVPALQWVDAALPCLARDLSACGFHEHSAEALLACTPAQLRPPASLAELAIEAVDAESSLAAVRENLDANAFGFDPTGASLATDEQAQEFRAGLKHARAFTARWDGQAAGAGMYTDPDGGITELMGIATLEAFRGRGIAAALTAHMAQAAFSTGCALVFLTTTNPTAQRVYQRTGFAPIGALVTYVQDANSMATAPAPGDAWPN